MAKRPVFLAIVTVVTVAVVLSITLLGFPPGRSDPEAFAHLFEQPENGNQTHLHVDVDPTNGSRPCDPLDSTRKVVVGDTYDVALCLETYAPNKLEAFKLRLYYDSINTSPTLVGSPPMLDLNPDANDGDDPAGFSLGGGWDCSGFTVFPPVGDDLNTACVDQFGRPITPCHDAVIVCTASIVTPDLDLAANPGLLATVQFTATGDGTERLTWGGDTELIGTGLVVPDGDSALCSADVPENQIGCFGATLQKFTWDCMWEDDLWNDTSMGIEGRTWEFRFPGGVLAGSGGVMRVGDRAIVSARTGNVNVFGWGTCPSGPANVVAFSFRAFPFRFLRLLDLRAED